MTEILETVMLVCFGISWPLTVYRNIKSKTAKTMSLGFIVLIIVGYLAGITAKISSDNVGFVLAVYVINLIIVSVNLAVYFRNRHFDKMRDECRKTV
jgi:uncharacterized membrane protein (DUF485 family)